MHRDIEAAAAEAITSLAPISRTSASQIPKILSLPDVNHLRRLLPSRQPLQISSGMQPLDLPEALDRLQPPDAPLDKLLQLRPQPRLVQMKVVDRTDA